jgi:hypothetical protein
MRTVKISGITAAAAWAVGVAALMTLALAEPGTRSTLPNFFLGLMVYGAYGAGVVLPVAFLIVIPLVAFFLKRPATAHPIVSVIIGLLTGTAAAYLFLTRGDFDASYFRESFFWEAVGTAALAGAISGFVCIRQIRATLA